MHDGGDGNIHLPKIFEIDMIKKLRAGIGAVACTGLAVIFIPGFAGEIDAGIIPFSTIQLGNKDGGLVVDSPDAGCPHYSWPYGCDWRPAAGQKRIVKQVRARQHRFAAITGLERLQGRSWGSQGK